MTVTRTIKTKSRGVFKFRLTNDSGELEVYMSTLCKQSGEYLQEKRVHVGQAILFCMANSV